MAVPRGKAMDWPDCAAKSAIKGRSSRVIRIAEQGLGKNEPALSFRRAVEKAHEAAFAGLGSRQRLFPSARHMQLEPRTQALPHQRKQVSRNAHMLARGIDHLEG